MNSQLAPIYTVESISGFAGALVGVFVPVYLLTLGYSVRSVMLFSLMQAVAGIFAIIGTAWLSRRLPLKLIMILRVPVLIAFLWLLIAAKSHTVPLALLATLEAFHFVLYYLPLHVFFTFATDERTINRQVGLLSALPKFVSLAAPLLAGIIAARLGFNAVFAAAAVLYAASAVPMTRLSSTKAAFTLSPANFVQLYRRYRTYFWLEIVENIQEEFDLVIWPFFVYLLVQNTIQTGAVATIIGAASAVFTYLVGRSADHLNKFRLLRLGGLAMMLLWLWRLTPLSAGEIFVISTLVGFSGVLISIPFGGIIYNLARTNDPRHFVIFREIPIGIARIFVYSLAVLAASNLQHLFWLAVGAYAVFALMPRFQTSPLPAA